jgi:hypothetical protein
MSLEFNKRENLNNNYSMRDNNYNIETIPSDYNVFSYNLQNSILTPRNNKSRQSSLKIRRISSNILNQNDLSKINNDQILFHNLYPSNDNLIKYRTNSNKKYKTRIKKEIDFISNSFRNSISPKFDDIFNKNNNNNFNLSYTTTVSALKNYNRIKKSDFRYQVLPRREQNVDEISILYKNIKEKRNNRKNNF